ncbi:MAG TPA: NAD(P)H-hydrate epimerase [Pirellulaceae bacterium]
MRDIDRRAIEEFGVPGIVLMENAGRGCVEVLVSLACNGPVIIVCGKGNNAGDGFVMARHLDVRRIPVKLLLIGAADELRGDAAMNYAIVAKSQLPMIDFSKRFEAARFAAELEGAEWIVDALLGTGSTGSPRPPMDEAIRLMNSAVAKRLAVDLPSGLDCDTGEPAEPTFRADHTCIFVAEKIGFAKSAAKAFLGQVHVVDIGAPRPLVQSSVWVQK